MATPQESALVARVRVLVDQGKAQSRTLDAHDFLARQGDEPNKVWFVISGLLRIFRSELNGRESLIGLTGPGEFLGELEVLLHDPLFCQIQCDRSTEIVEFSGPTFRDLIDTDPLVREALLLSFASRLRRSTQRRSDAVAYPLEDLVMKLLRSNEELGQHFTRKMYADYLGVSERSVNRAVATLEESGHLVRVAGRLRTPKTGER